MNYLIPVYRTSLQNIDISEDKKLLNLILDQQIIISQLSEGGITYEDTENMDEYERCYIFSKLVQMQKEKNEAKQRAIDEMNKK